MGEVIKQRTARLADDDEDLPVIEQVKHLKIKALSHDDGDEFGKPATTVKQYSGTDAVFKRRVTNELKKVRRGSDGTESQQIQEESFLTGYDAFDVVQPSYNLDYLAKLYELSSPHYSAVNAKVANIVGLGFKLVENNKSKRNFERMADNAEKVKKERRRLDLHRDDVLEKLEGMNEEDTLTEVLVKVWRDYEVTGNGYIEVARKKDGTIGYIGHIPAQTLRRRRKRDGYVQVSGFKAQFFANFGDGIDSETKEPVTIPNPVNSGGKTNEIIHIMKYSPTSGFYGIPDIVAAKQAIAGNEFAARYNLDYFENKAVPRYAIIVKGATLGSQAENDLLTFFETAVKGQNHRSIIIPLPAHTKENPVDIDFQAIENGVQDASFTNYRRANLSDILMAHRVPISKVSTAEGASLAIARDADKTFKEQVCAPEQRVFEKKLNRIVKELSDALDLKLNEMTLTDENTQSQIDERRRKTGVETANEQRLRRGEPAIEGGDELFDMNAAVKLAEMSDKTTRRGQDKAAEKPAAPAPGAAGANANGNPTGTRQRDTQRTANATDSAGEGRNPKGEGRTTT